MLLVRVFCGDITKMPEDIFVPFGQNGSWSDDSNLDLPVLVFNLLEETHLAGHKNIAIPPLRITSTSDFILTMRAVLDIKEGIFDFKNKYPESNLLINIVVDNNEDLKYLIRGVLCDYC